jgi:hypothetical protein
MKKWLLYALIVMLLMSSTALLSGCGLAGGEAGDSAGIENLFGAGGAENGGSENGDQEESDSEDSDD